MSEPNTVERAQRQVIEKKLLTALQGEGTVAILASKDDLKLLADAASYYGLLCGDDIKEDCAEMSRGLRQLLAEAFP